MGVASYELRLSSVPVDAGGGKYAAQIDLNANDSHALMIRMVGGGKRVLDIGCWTGDMGAELARFNPRVVGIEIDPDAAEQAKKALDDVVVDDVTTLDFDKTFGAAAFDVIVFGDVLEHVTDPVSVLRNSLAVLAPGGFVVASIPNVAHGSVRISLLNGRFDYTPTGLLDETHLRFFTRASVADLFADAGLAIVDLQRTIVDPVQAIDRPIDEATVPADLLRDLRADLEAMTYQFIVKAVRDDGTQAVAAMYDKLQRLERELVERRGGRPDGVPRGETGAVLRVAAMVGRGCVRPDLDCQHLRDVLEREVAARVHGPVDLRLLEADGDVTVGPPGWGADLVLCLGGHGLAPVRQHVRPVIPRDVDLTAVDADLDAASSMGLLASRLATPPELSAHVDLLRATHRFPAVDKVVAVVLADEPASLIEHLARALSSEMEGFEGALLLAPEPAPVEVARFEALWPGHCVVRPRPVEMTELLAVFAGSQAVVSSSPFDRAAAASLGIRTAGTGNPDGVLTELQISLAAVDARAGVVLALDRALDEALAGVDRRGTHRDDDEVAWLRTTVNSLQSRISEERLLLADHVADLRVSIAAAEARELRAEAAVISASLDAQREALIRLQDDYRAVSERKRRWRRTGPSMIRRLRGRLGRSLVGRVKRRLTHYLRRS